MAYERDNIRALTAYTPGEQPQETKVVKLNTNENPYPPSPAVLEAVRAVSAESLRRYPPPSAETFRRAAARAHGLSPDQVIATNGGDELLRLAVTVFCDPRPSSALAPTPATGTGLRPAQRHGAGSLVMTEPSYSLYPVLADIHDTLIHRVPLNDDWSVPADFAPRALALGCRLAIIVNPHAPSGRLESLESLESVARALQGQAVLMVDEAYVDFATRDALPLLDPSRGLDNVLLLRSLSKGYSLAGLRFGYGLGHANLIASMNKAKDSYNTDILSQAAATAALEHRDEARKSWAAVIGERTRVTAELERRGYRVSPSQSNFILATPPAGGGAPTAKAIYESLKQRSLFVRYFDQDRLRDKLRITIGTPAENNALLTALGELAR
ncbi:MAG: aminotransferase class I/II-fold pyridoxal phosphate-dependent enzyme [Planctomycetota bacterium]|nr:aminotransferase class I/II-fold pyridoxal phosphate-dependent enzyme [Planctomycetota bacterium]